MQITISQDSNQAVPPFTGEIERITVLLGANGAGKSKLMGAMMNAIVGQVGPTNVLRLLPMSQIGDIGFENSMVLAQAQMQVAAQVSSYAIHSQLPNRFYIPENIILQELQAIDADYERIERQAYQRHRTDPVKHADPGYRQSSFNQLCEIFNSVVDVNLSYNHKTAHFEATSRHYLSLPYRIDRLSSGEQWIFRTLPAFIRYKDQPMYVFVDEPEAMLNEQLAVDFWTYIEDQRPEWKFLYATHSVNFAARQSIDNLYLLRSPAIEPHRIDHIAELSRVDKRALLGIGPRLALAKKALFVEGEDQSIDVPFYETVLAMEDVLISSVGGSNSVKQATAQTGYWERLKLDELVIRGCVDRDSCLDLDGLSSSVASILLHDIEAYLCLPTFLTKVASFTAGSTNEIEYSDVIVEHCKATRNNLIYKHLDRLFPATDTISIPKQERVSSGAIDIAAGYIRRRNEMFSGTTARYSDIYISREVEKVVTNIDEAIDSKNIFSLLMWFSGKGLIEKLCPIAAIRDKSQAIRLIKKHDLVDRVDELRNLRVTLKQLFN